MTFYTTPFGTLQMGIVATGMELNERYKTTNGWWIVYLIVGAVASMLIGEIISAVKQGIGRVTKKILMKPYKM